MPSQLKQSIPWFSFCQDVFTAYDPPTALAPATAFGPGPTPAEGAKTRPLTPAPSVTLDPGARKTVVGEGSVPSLTSSPAVERLKQTIDPVPLSQMGDLSYGPSSAKKGSDGNHANDPIQSSSTSEDPSQASNVKSSHAQQDSGQGYNDNSQFKQSSGASEGPSLPLDPSVPGPAPKSTAAVNNNGDSNQNAGSSLPGNVEQKDNTNAVGGYPSQGTTADSPDNSVKPITHSDILDFSKDDREPPDPLTVPPTPLNPVKKPPITSINNGFDHPQSSDNNPVIGTRTNPVTAESRRSIITNIGGQAITAVLTAIIVPDKVLKPGDPNATLHGTAIALDKTGQLIIGSKTIPIPTGTNSAPFSTTINGQAITATAAAVTIAGTTLGPGSVASVDGTLLSLDTAGHFLVGSKTLTFESVTAESDTGPFASQTAVVTGTDQHNTMNQTGKGMVRPRACSLSREMRRIWSVL